MKRLGFLLLSAVMVSCDRTRNTADSNQALDNQSHTQAARRDRNEVDPSPDILELAERITAASKEGDFTREHLIEHLEHNERKAIAALLFLKGEHDYQLIREALLEYYDKVGPEKGLRAIEMLEAQPTIATPLLAEMLMRYHTLEPQQSLDWLKKHSYLSGALNAAATLGRTMGEADEPGQLVDELLTTVDDDTLRENLLIGVADTWINEDFNGAFEYFSEVATGRLPDRLFYELVSKGNRVDAGNTMVWAESIKNPGLQRSAIYETALQWQSTDLDAYRKWKAEAKLPDDLFKELP